MSFTTARTVDDALTAISQGARPIAGGSDLVVGARHGKADLPNNLVAIDRVDELRTIAATADGCTIGAAVTHAKLMTSGEICDNYTALADSAALVGSPATRNVGTLGGNVMNASPAMDTGAPLVVLRASVILRSLDSTRTVPVSELWTAPGQTIARTDELCTAIELPSRMPASGSAYVRLEYRRAMEIAVVGAAASVELDGNGQIVSASVALAAVAPTIIGVSGLDDLTGRHVDEQLLAQVATAASAAARPISDLRASDDYRRHVIGVMARRAFDAANRRAQGQTIAVPVNRSMGVGQ